MKYKIAILLLVFSVQKISAQIKGFYDGTTYYEVDVKQRVAPQKKINTLSFFFGPSNYLGDLGGNDGVGKKYFYDNNLKKRTFFYGFSLTHYRKNAVGFRFSYTTGKIAGGDEDVEYKSKTDNAYTRYKRNLNFQSKISEGSIIAEIFPLKFISYTRAAHQWNLQPYGMIGIGRYKFNPQGSYFDDIADDYVWVDLQPLRTEGQGMAEYPNRKQYKLSQTNIPFGFGLQYSISDKTSLSFEFLGRKLYTDYLDDVSETFIDPNLYASYLSEDDAALARLINNKSNIIDPDNPYRAGDKRGDPSNNDFYYSFNIKFSVRISKMNDIANFFKGKIYKYDNDEICE